MRRPAALTFAALSLFTLSLLPFAQAQTGQTPSSSSEKSAEAQSSDKSESSSAKPASDQSQQNSSSQAPSSPEKSASEKSGQGDKSQVSTGKADSTKTEENPFDKFQQFSAKLSGGPLRFDNMPIYRLGNQIRTDWAYEHEVRISDVSIQNGWFMRHWPGRPEKCGPTEKMDIGSYPFFAYTGKDYKVEHVHAAQPEAGETLHGHPTKIEHYTATRTSDGVLVAKIKMWEATDLNGFPVRMEIDPPLMGKVFNLYYNDVSLARPDPKLFEVPERCQKDTEPDTDSEDVNISPKQESSKPAKPPENNQSSKPPQ